MIIKLLKCKILSEWINASINCLLEVGQAMIEFFEYRHPYWKVQRIFEAGLSPEYREVPGSTGC
jgi:hypothetical protein